MIEFRCWYCNRRYHRPREQVGKTIKCSCDNLLRVPRRNGGNCRVKAAVDWLVEGIVYGGGGGLLGFCSSLLVLRSMPRHMGHTLFQDGVLVIPLLTLVGFLIGLLGGERGMNWVGQMIRGQENR
jgi:hypothetical protein